MMNYVQAPLPFQGQKRRFITPFKEALNGFQSKTTFVDLFGGSGLLSHTVKQAIPGAHVVYNDFDNYTQRLANIARTNAILDDLRVLLADYPADKKLSDQQRAKVLERLSKEMGFVDYITLSSSLLFSMNYATSFEELAKQTMYNVIRKSGYALAPEYLQGVDVVQMDYKELYRQYKDVQGVVFLVDPPYLSTDVSTYNKEDYWKLSDYLDVLQVVQHHSYFYFTSNKSEIIELCDWMEKNLGLDNPFREAVIKEVYAKLTPNSGYTDIMLYRQLV
ncbi:DNA adenine methylase [Paludibacter sp.]|uniref:DNA adenine methylase n=1 Tax=Paludibacter sp. TaxID=1898105 RepID=UPI001352FD6D|nr:DNA adenine methylase [Paludibacter sp.]MTK53309.1 DNA adenine methylase [Paludibacter sp.]